MGNQELKGIWDEKIQNGVAYIEANVRESVSRCCNSDFDFIYLFIIDLNFKLTLLLWTHW